VRLFGRQADWNDAATDQFDLINQNTGDLQRIANETFRQLVSARDLLENGFEAQRLVNLQVQRSQAANAQAITDLQTAYLTTTSTTEAALAEVGANVQNLFWAQNNQTIHIQEALQNLSDTLNTQLAYLANQNRLRLRGQRDILGVLQDVVLDTQTGYRYLSVCLLRVSGAHA
jgi:hypothetical protein